MSDRIGFAARLREDVTAARLRDPAARNGVEIALLYPGLHAIWAHRVNHWLWRRGFRFVARAGSQLMRWFTGVEIHPGATNRKPRRQSQWLTRWAQMACRPG